MLSSITEKRDLWSYLKPAGKPVVMYGMGNGADKIIAVLDRYGVNISDFFASDGFVRGHSFHSKKVLSFSEIKEKYGDFIILLSFGTSRREVLDLIYSIDEEYEMYAPDVPVAGGDIFDIAFYNRHTAELERTRELLCDERSKELFDSIINYKLSGEIKYLRENVSDRSEIYNRILKVAKYKSYLDLGAYTGDTVREIYEFGGRPEMVTALEPDPRNFRKLSQYASENPAVNAINAGAWSRDTVMIFNTEGNRNSGVSDKGGLVQMLAPDGIESAQDADLIKLDVEGSEREALLGCRGIIERSSPDLLVSVYHRSEDLYDLPLLVHELAPGHKLYLRRLESLPAWDLYLIAVNEK